MRTPPPEQPREAARQTRIENARKAAIRLARLRMESLRLYEPMAHIQPFHECMAPERILRGSNQAGKTLGAAVEFARGVTGQDPEGKYPLKDGVAIVVGKDGKHNAETIFRKICRPGAFQIIKDLDTGSWRSWRPWLPEDFARRKEIRPAPPLIPARLIKEISWESLKEKQPAKMMLVNGWEVRFYSSLGSPPQGMLADIAWFDEEIVNPEWYPEVSARLIAKGGRFVWSATAQLGGAQLYDLCLVADELRGTPSPRVVEFFAHIEKNRYFTDEQRELFFSKLTEEQRRIRVEGEFAFTALRVYPEFDLRRHGVDPFPIPGDWTRYMVVDPGRQVCAVLFIAVPPPKDNDHHVYLYDELYIRSCNAAMFADKVREKTQGFDFQAFIIDYRGSRVRLLDSGSTVEQQYSKALKERGVESISTGSSFTWASDEVEAGIEKFRSWLNPTSDKDARLRVFRGRLPNLEYEAQRYHYQRSPKTGLTDKPNQQHNHLMDCCRYIAMYDPRWVKPRRRPKKYDPYAIVQSKLKKLREKHGGPYVSFGR